MAENKVAETEIERSKIDKYKVVHMVGTGVKYYQVFQAGALDVAVNVVPEIAFLKPLTAIINPATVGKMMDANINMVDTTMHYMDKDITKEELMEEYKKDVGEALGDDMMQKVVSAIPKFQQTQEIEEETSRKVA